MNPLSLECMMLILQEGRMILMNIAKIWNNGVREEGRHIHANVWFSSKTGQSFITRGEKTPAS